MPWVAISLLQEIESQTIGGLCFGRGNMGERGSYGNRRRESPGESEIRKVFPEEVLKIQRIDSTQLGDSMRDA